VPRLAAAVGIAAILSAGTVQAEMRLFDMGPPGSPVWRGAALVTPDTSYSPETGFGWETVGNLEGVKRQVPDDLGSDFVQGQGAFVVDTDQGSCGVWVLLCDSGYGINAPRSWVESYTISVNDEEVVSVDRGMETYLREYLHAGWDADWDPSQSLFDKYFARYDRPHEFVVRPMEGKLRVVFSAHCPVAAVAVWPAAEGPGAKAALAAVREARRSQFDGSWSRAPRPAGLKPAEYTPTDRKRGYAAWVRDCGDGVRPYTEPRAAERKARLEALACLGEYEPLSLCLRPLQPLVGAKVIASDLKGPGKSLISSGDIRVSWVKYVEHRLGPGRYEVRPQELLPSVPRDLSASVTKQCWLTIHVSESTRPGRYRGTVTIEAESRRPTRLPLVLTVLPVRLGSPGMLTGMYYSMPDATDLRPFRSGDMMPEAAELLRRQLADMREHGMNAVAPEPPWDLLKLESGTLAYNEQAWQHLDEFFRLYREAGFSAPVPLYQIAFILMLPLPDRPVLDGENAWQSGEAFAPALRERYAESVRRFYARAHQAQEAGNWPEVLYYASDELSNKGRRGGEWGVRHLELLREIRTQVPGGFRVCCSMNGSPEHAMLPLLDIAIPNFGFPITEQTLTMVSDADAELWFYNLGWERFTWGYFPVRCGARGRLQWHYHSSPQGTCDPHNRLTSSMWGVTMGPDGPLANVDWEMIREGIDDARLVNTLRDLLKQARDRGVGMSACQEAESDLAWLMDSIRPDLSYYRDEAGYWDSGVYKDLKWMLGQDCVALEAALAKGQ